MFFSNNETMKKYSREDQKLLATWAADCAARVLPIFEKAHPQDDRPRKAIEACREWVSTGVFRMAVIRAASLGAHAAAREVLENEPACFAARAAGHAVAVAHVSQHAYSSALYALKSVAAMDKENAEVNTSKERNWQSRHLPEGLRAKVMNRITIVKKGTRTFVKLQKDEDF
jgi:hypothetical protein